MSPLDPARLSDEGAHPVPARRPFPVPRPRTEAAAPVATGAAAPEVLPEAAPAVAEPSRPAVRWARRLRPPVRRPAVLLAAALAGALSVAVVPASTGDASASASPATDVAAELGLTGDGGTPSPAVAAGRLRALAASRAQRQAERTSAAAARAAADQAAVEAARPRTVDPAPGARLTSTYAMRWGVMHWGIDLAGPVGTPEYAAADGVVLRAGPAGGFGQAVYIQHAGGDVTVYGHMEKLLVTTGQVVRAGDEIALMGAEGEATGPHLHFEVHQGGIEGPRTDPLTWLAARGVTV